MSTLNVSNITDGTTTVGTSYVVNGSAKAWANYDQNPTGINKSFNVSSLTDISTGRHRVNFSNSFIDSSIVTTGLSGGGGDGRVMTNRVSAATYTENSTTGNDGVGVNDNDGNSVVVHGDLA